MSSRFGFLKPAITICAVLVLFGYVLAGISHAADEFRSYRYTGTNVRFDPQVKISWTGPVKTPAEGSHIRGQIVSRVKAAMGRHLPAKLSGTKPSRVEVIVKQVAIPGAGLRVIGSGDYTILATINLIDNGTGKVLVSRPDFGAVAATGKGIVGVVVEDMVAPNSGLDRVVDNLAMAYGNWLSYWATK